MNTTPILGTAPVLRVLTPVVQVVVVVSWVAGVGFTGLRAPESRNLISTKGPIKQGGTRRRSRFPKKWSLWGPPSKSSGHQNGTPNLFIFAKGLKTNISFSTGGGFVSRPAFSS